MSEPWNLRTDDEREANTKTNFIIFCEDEVSEPVYFKYIETDKIKINCIPNQKSMMKNVINAIDHCTENGLIQQVDGEHLIIEDLHIWCVFDRDKEETTKEKIRKGNIEFDESIDSAERKGIKVAWSNDIFETWVLLHFEEADQTERIDVYNRLTEIFNALPNQHEDLEKARTHAHFNYKHFLKNRIRFINIVRSAIVGKTSQAIKRAKELDKSSPPNAKPSEKAPCTKVYLLVEELLHYGQKLELA